MFFLHGHARGRTRPNLTTCLALLVMVQALLLPVYGPLLDYDYAAGQPGHDHLYIGQVDLFHHHRHADDSNGTTTVAVGEDGCSRQSGVVNLPSQNASDSAWSSWFLPANTAMLLPAIHRPDLTHPFQAHYLARQGISTAPPEKPPRV